MSDTPRTDAQPLWGAMPSVAIGFARTLERELAQAVRERDELKARLRHTDQYVADTVAARDTIMRERDEAVAMNRKYLVAVNEASQRLENMAAQLAEVNAAQVNNAAEHSREVGYLVEERNEAIARAHNLGLDLAKCEAQLADTTAALRAANALRDLAITERAAARACIRDAISRLQPNAKGIREWVGGDDDIARWERHGLGEGAR